MPSQTPPTSIRLRIKVPPGHIEGAADEFALDDELPVTTRLGAVREQIQRAVLSNPSPERQRLLYGGRALVDNEQTIGDALNIRRDPTQTEYVVHLLVRNDASAAPTTHLHHTSTTSASPREQTPVAPSPEQRQPQAGPNRFLPAPHGLPVALPPHIHPQHLMQHQAAVQAQQQRLQAQMLLNAGPNRFAHNAAGPMPFPMQNVMPAGPNAFQNAVAHAQQNRAAMGMQGVQNANVAPPTGEGTSPGPTTNAAPDQPTSTSPTPTSQQQPQPGHDGAPANPGSQQPSQPPRRPISNQGIHFEGVNQDGTRYTLTHQQFYAGGPPQAGQPLAPPPWANFMQPPGFPAMALPPLAPAGQTNARTSSPSALDRARDNLRQIDEITNELRLIRTVPIPPPEQVRLLNRLEEQTRAVWDYIDPFGLGRNGNMPAPVPNSPQPPAGPQTQIPPQFPPIPFPTFMPNLPLQPPPAANLAQANHTYLRAASNNADDVTCYLISSPRGPEALLYSPQHGAFAGSQRYQPLVPTGLPPVPTRTAPANNDAAPPEIAPPDAQLVRQERPLAAPGDMQGQRQAPGHPGAVNPLQLIAGPLWMLFRILLFGYFFLGTNMGWRRPLILLAVGAAFWLFRLGLFGDGGVLRQWWEGIIGMPAPVPNPAGPDHGDPAGEDVNNEAAPQQGDGRPVPNRRRGGMPTPEEVAHRLLDERRRARAARWAWIREQIRPLERTLALLVASLWPGIGERYVRALEEEERRRLEAEVARQREVEEARRKAEEEKAEKKREAEGEEGEAAGSDTTSGTDVVKADVEAEAGPAMATSTDPRDADGAKASEEVSGSGSV